MRALVWHGKEDVRVDTVPDPTIQKPTDAIIRVTSTAICGSDLHLYGGYAIKLESGDILGHEPMGIVEEVGADVTHIKAGDRVVIPFNISCGSCFMCDQHLYSQCETTGSKEHGKGAALFGYTHLYGGVPVMDTRRAREELGWTPRHTAEEALLDLVTGMRESRGVDTPPLSPTAGGPLRIKELLSGIGGKN